MRTCVFCEPESFGARKLKVEDKKGYWYMVIPNEIGTFGQVLMVVTKREEDQRHIIDITDPELLNNEERLKSIFRGIIEISGKLRKCLKDQKGRKVEKVYVLTQCEDENSHLHFQFYPRYEGDPIGNEFLYTCEFEEARWQDPPKLRPCERIEKGKRILEKYERLLERNEWTLPTECKSKSLERIAQRLNEIFVEP